MNDHCPICSSKLEKINTPIMNRSRIASGETLCSNCYTKLIKRIPGHSFLKKMILSDVVSTLKYKEPTPIQISLDIVDYIKIISAFIVFLIVVVLWNMWPSMPSNEEFERAEKERINKLTPKEQRREHLQDLIRKVSYREMVTMIKKDMHNPSSFEEDYVNFWDHKDSIMVVFSFRGTNVFGGVVTNQWLFKADTLGHVQLVERKE